MRHSLAVVFAGSGGAGAMTAGTVFLRSAARAGYYGMMTQLFGPQVRGGESAALIQIAVEPVDCPPDRFDVFVALDWGKVDQFAPEIPLDERSVVLADPDSGAPSPGIMQSKARLVSVPMSDPTRTRLEKAMRGKRQNIFAAAAVAAAAGIDTASIDEALREVLGRKGAQAQEANAAAAHAGIAAAASLGLDLPLAPAAKQPRWLITGNEAVSVGTLRGGIRFVGCYPITPATTVPEWLAPELHKLGGRLVLAEDELASINMVVGASFAGVPAMTVTSGPGFALMSETIGLAVAAEIPLVVIDVMRGGPSTGLPSKTEQSDLDIAIYGGHGDAPRIVVAPISVSDCLLTGEWAVYLAESLQTPVVLLSEAAFGQARAVIDPTTRRPPVLTRRTNGLAPGAPFKRYALGPDPITPMPAPGTPGCQWVGEGLTHNEVGLPTGAASVHVAQINKRAKKFTQLDPGDLWGEVWGEGDTAIVAFGSTIGPAREAARRLTAVGRPTRVVGLRLLSPLPIKQLAHALNGVTRIVVIEQNDGAQFYRHLIGHHAVPGAAESIARPGPLPFRPAELTAHLA
jgi:2-oxoglutarate ferredoxin oxidoreductase subunit alpha